MRLLVDNVWPDIREIAARGNSSPRIAITAYFTNEKSLPLGRGDLLIVDASDERIKTGGTSAKAIAQVCENGAAVYSLAGLHAKLFVLGSNVIVGSANMTDNSEKLTEAAFASDNPKLLADASKWVKRLRKRANRVDRLFLKHILALPVTRLPRTAGAKSKLSLLQAVQADDPLLLDFTFRAYSEDTTISNAAVERAVKSDGELKLPENWTFFEDEWGAPERKVVDSLESRYLISFEGTGVEGEKLESFDRLDPDALSFLYPLKIRDSLVSVFDDGKPCAFLLSGPDAQQLCDLMNAGLEASPKLHSRINRAPLWDFTAETLRALVTAGESSSRAAQLMIEN